MRGAASKIGQVGRYGGDHLIILSIMFALIGAFLALVVLQLRRSEKRHIEKCLYATATITKYKFPENSLRMEPYVTFEYKGKPQTFLAKVGKMDGRNYPPGTEVKISYSPKVLLPEVWLEESGVVRYTTKKSSKVMIIIGIASLILALVFAII